MEKKTSEEKDVEFDIVISFAGEDRHAATAINDQLKGVGIKTFFDEDHKLRLWGTNLAEELFKIYSQKGKYCLLILSQDYLQKMWTRHERRAALSRMIRENYGYLLVYILDDTKIEALDGISPDIGYLSAKDTSQEEMITLLAQKVTQSELIAIRAVINQCRKFILEALYKAGQEEKHLRPLSRKVVVGDSELGWEYRAKYPHSTEIMYLGKAIRVFSIALDELRRENYIYQASDERNFSGSVHDLTLKGWAYFDGNNIDKRVFLKELYRTLVEIAMQLEAIVDPNHDPRDLITPLADKLKEIVRLHGYLVELINNPIYEVFKRYLRFPDALDVEIGNVQSMLGMSYATLHDLIESDGVMSHDISMQVRLASGICFELTQKLSDEYADLDKQLGAKE